MNKKNVLLYHANCPDGFGSAYSFWKKFQDKMEYVPVSHGKPPPDGLKGKKIFIADFSYDKETLMSIKKDAESIVVIDHHISAKKELDGLDFCHFDMDHSGAYLSWAYNFPNESVPKLIKYIEDRDLWLWKMPHAQEILSAVDSYERTFEWWEHISSLLESQDGFERLVNEGKAILRYKLKLVENIKKNSYKSKILGKDIRVINTPFFQSEIASSLSEGEAYAAAYYFNGDKFVFSLRSSNDHIDVSEIAKNFGGGGHKKASGFSVFNLDDLNEDIK